jgi:peptide/nickel transport system substrate-binding protein
MEVVPVRQLDQRRTPQSPLLAAVDRRQFLRGVAATGIAAGAGGLLAACSSSSTSTSPSSTPTSSVSGTPKAGGTLSAGLTGGSSSDTVDPAQGLTYLDMSRILCLYSPLVQLDAQAKIVYVLAESIEPKNNNPSEWIIKLKPGVTYHSGKPLTSADVIYTFNRVVSKGYSGSNGLGPIDIKGVKALDDLTVYVPMTAPASGFVARLASFWLYLCISPANFNPSAPDGTGPFVYQSFTPGQRSVFTKNPNYFKSGLPYADTLEIIDFPDTTSLQDALTTGVVQAAGTLDGPSMAALSSVSGVHPLPSKTGGFEPFTMRVDLAPFSDVRVRQAMRLLVDRPQLIDSALDGYGTLGNDVFSPFDPFYDTGLPQREQDIPQAKFLLKQAGFDNNLTVTLTTSPIATATVALATVLKEQASAAGVTINISNVQSGTFFGTNYLSWPFSQDYYGYSPYLAQVAQSMLPKAPFNETHEKNPTYVNLYNEANSTFDQAKQEQIVHEMMTFDYNEGGYIIPAFNDFLDAYSTKIGGYTTSAVGQPLANFGYEYFGFLA